MIYSCLDRDQIAVVSENKDVIHNSYYWFLVKLPILRIVFDCNVENQETVIQNQFKELVNRLLLEALTNVRLGSPCSIEYRV
jgi:hypothetical protein